MSETDPVGQPAVPGPATPPIAPAAAAAPSQATPAAAGQTTPYGATPVAPAAAAPKTGTWQIVVGIIVIVLSLGSWPRGILGVIVGFARPGTVSPYTAFGVLAFGLFLLAIGIALLVVGMRNRKRSRPAVQAYAPGVAGAPQVPPAPPTT